MAIMPRPLIDNLTLSLQQDVANAVLTVEYDINWPEFARNTDIAYTESVRLIGMNTFPPQVLWTNPILANGLSANGDKTTHREHSDTIAWDVLDENPSGDDQIAAEVTLTPRLPVAVTRQSAVTVVQAP